MDSILTQTYHKLEILLIDDGSTDLSGAVCDEYAKQDSRVKVIHKENAGVSSARNVGLDMAQGEWIGFVDPDDWIEPDMFEVLCQTAMETSALITACGYIKHCPDGWIDERICFEIPTIVPLSETLSYVLRDSYFEGFVWNKLFNRTFIQNEMILFEHHLYTCQDIVFVTELVVKGATIAYASKILYHYIMREGSNTKSFNTKRLTELDAWGQVIKQVSPVGDTWVKLAQFRYTASAIGLLHSAVSYSGKPYIPKLKKEARRYARQYFFTREIGFRLKLRGLAIMLFPKTSYRFWQLIKRIFRITWWNKELKGENI
jgi:glycosyltransferase involved in cell wall biosynthesis